MTTANLTANGFTAEMDYDGALDFREPWFAQLLDACSHLHAVVPLTRVLFKPDPDDATVYIYRIDAADGRRWKQAFRFAGPTDGDPGMTFDVSDEWKLSEFKYHRVLRDVMVGLHVASQVQRIEVTW